MDEYIAWWRAASAHSTPSLETTSPTSAAGGSECATEEYVNSAVSENDAAVRIQSAARCRAARQQVGGLRDAKAAQQLSTTNQSHATVLQVAMLDKNVSLIVAVLRASKNAGSPRK
jgi:hypothetical protein